MQIGQNCTLKVHYCFSHEDSIISKFLSLDHISLHIQYHILANLGCYGYINYCQ